MKVIGIGGGGGNAVNYLYSQNIPGLECVLINSDIQALNSSSIPKKIIIGNKEGLGAAANPKLVKNLVRKSQKRINNELNLTNDVLVLVAGLGGGTGSGATPLIAQLAKAKNIFTVVIVTLPFNFEGKKRIKQALQSLSEIRKNADLLILLENDQLRYTYGDLILTDAFSKSDMQISQIIVGINKMLYDGLKENEHPLYEFFVENKGLIGYSSGIAEGKDRIEIAFDKAISNPSISNFDFNKSHRIHVNFFTSHENELTSVEIKKIEEILTRNFNSETSHSYIIANDDKLKGKLRIDLFFAGFIFKNIKQDWDLELAKVLKSKNEELSLYFLEDEYSTSEISEIISFLSDIYEDIGGDRLVINGLDVLDFKTVNETIVS